MPDGKKAPVWWKRDSWLIVFAVFLAVAMALIYLFIHGSSTSAPLSKDSNPIRTAMLLAGVVLATCNMIFIVRRMRKTDTQIEKSEDANFLHALNQGLNMLYGDSHSKRMSGVEHLHQLGATNKNNQQRVQRIVDVFCAAVRNTRWEEEKFIDSKEGELYKKKLKKDNERAKKRNDELKTFKTEILANVLGNEGNAFYHDKKKNLENLGMETLSLGGIQLPAANLNGAGLARANLSASNLAGARLDVLCPVLSGCSLPSRTDLTCSDLRGVDFGGDNRGCLTFDLSGADLRGAKNFKVEGTKGDREGEISMYYPLISCAIMEIDHFHPSEDGLSVCLPPPIPRLEKKYSTRWSNLDEKNEKEKQSFPGWFTSPIIAEKRGKKYSFIWRSHPESYHSFLDDFDFKININQWRKTKAELIRGLEKEKEDLREYNVLVGIIHAVISRLENHTLFPPHQFP